MYGSAAGGRGFLRAYECVDVRRDLESCGGCVYDDSPFGERSADGGRDCSAIPFVDAVACSAGQCIVCERFGFLLVGTECGMADGLGFEAKCREGYVPAEDASSCVASFLSQQLGGMNLKAQLRRHGM